MKKTFNKKNFTAKNQKAITDLVIKGLEEKGMQWFKPFKDSTTGHYYPVNIYGTRYKDWTTQFILSNTAMNNGWVNKWATKSHILKNKGEFLEGQDKNGTVIYGWFKTNYYEGQVIKDEDIKDLSDEDKEKVKAGWVLKGYIVYSISQTTLDINKKYKEAGKKAEDLEEIPSAEQIVKSWSKEVKLTHSGQGRAYYSPSKDLIHMPNKKSDQWKCSGDYYKVYFHEAIHSTGHKSRLDRLDKIAAFGSDEYSKEELIAEMGALYLESITGIETVVDDFKNSQAYINGWIKAFKKQKDLITTASKQARLSVDLILSKVK